MNTQIVIGSYAGESMADYYRPKENIIKVVTKHGTMWVALAGSKGMRNRIFDPESERVLVILDDPDQVISMPEYDRDEEGAEAIDTTELAVGFIIQIPVQYTRDRMVDPEEEVNVPSKLMVGSNSLDEERHVFGTEEAKVICTKDMVALKAPGGQIVIGRDGIMIDGTVIDMEFFTSSKAGLLKENYLAAIIPTTVVTPFPAYLPDDTILQRIAGLVDIIKVI